MIQETYVTFEEIWKPIKNYESYQISNTGKVKNKYSKILKPLLTHDGYYRVALCKENKVKFYFIHRLVAETFLDNPNNFPVVDHINTNRIDNSVLNLRWCTIKDNCNNSLSISHHSGEAHWQYGKHVSNETKQKISNSKLGVKCSEESKIKRSINGKRKHMKAIKQLSLSGELIKVWASAQDASIALEINKSNIGQAALGKRNNAGNFKWEFV